MSVKRTLLSLLSPKKSQSEKIGLVGTLNLKHTRDGKVLRTETLRNIIVDTGKAEVAGLINEVTTGGFKYLAIGVGAVAEVATDTALGSEITTGGGERAAAVCSRVTTTVTNDTAQMVKEWTFTAGFSITESGPFDAAAPPGIMLCRKTFSAYNVVSGDKFEVTWQIKVG